MWTRNYQNIISTNATCAHRGYNGGSAYSFGDGYCFNFKDPNGVVREICNCNGYNSQAALYITRGAFLKIEGGSTITPAVSTIINQAAALNGSNGYSWNTVYVGFGSSADEETFDDYALGSIISNFTKKSATATHTLNQDGTFTIQYQVIISASADITIREIGLFMPAAYMETSSTSASYAYYALINRIVLDEPISVASGEVANVTFSITTPKITFG